MIFPFLIESESPQQLFFFQLVSNQYETRICILLSVSFAYDTLFPFLPVFEEVTLFPFVCDLMPVIE